MQKIPLLLSVSFLICSNYLFSQSSEFRFEPSSMIAFGSPTLKNHVLGYNLGIKVPKKVSEKVRGGIAASYGRLSPFGNIQITDFIDFTNLQVFIEYEKNNDAKVRPTFGFGLSNMARWSNGHNLVLLRKSRNDFSIRGGDFINVNAGLNYFFEENLYFKFLSDFLSHTKLFNKKISRITILI